MRTIGTLNEQPLHSSLKDLYAENNGRMEVAVDGYFVDVIQNNQLIEIQTKHFYAIKKKIYELIKNHPLKLVYPIPLEKYLLKLSRENGAKPTRRKSPKRGQPYQVFSELVSFPELITYPNFELDIVMADLEEVRQCSVDKPWGQNSWQIVEQRLMKVREIIHIKKPADFSALLPETLSVKFTSADLHKAVGIPHWLAQKTAYCLRKAGTIKLIGKRGRYNLYEQTGGNL